MMGRRASRCGVCASIMGGPFRTSCERHARDDGARGGRVQVDGDDADHPRRGEEVEAVAARRDIGELEFAVLVGRAFGVVRRPHQVDGDVLHRYALVEDLAGKAETGGAAMGETWRMSSVPSAVYSRRRARVIAARTRRTGRRLGVVDQLRFDALERAGLIKLLPCEI